MNEPTNTDRAQMASLGRTIEQRAATIVATLGETDTPFFPSEIRDHEAYVAAEIRGAVAAADQARECFVTESGSARDALSRWVRVDDQDVTDTMLFRCKVCGRISPTPDKACNLISGPRPCREEWQRFIESEYALLTAERADAKREAAHWLTLYEQCVERLKQTVIDERRAHALADLVRRWTHGEEALIDDMSILAGTILGGPLEAMGSRPAAAGLDSGCRMPDVGRQEWLVCDFCVGTFEPGRAYTSATRRWTCPHCGAAYDEAELDDLEAMADGPDCRPDFDESATTRPDRAAPTDDSEARHGQ